MAAAGTAQKVGTRRPGGRAARVRQAILEAARAELAEKGPARVSLPEVARRAGVQKSSLYRRYPDVGALLAELALEAAAEAIPAPDTGDLAADLVGVLEAGRAFFATPTGRGLLHLSFTAHTPAEVAAVRGYWRARLKVLEAPFERARARSRRRVPPAEVALPLLIGGLWFQLFATGKGSARETRAAVAAVLGEGP